MKGRYSCVHRRRGGGESCQPVWPECLGSEARDVAEIIILLR